MVSVHVRAHRFELRVWPWEYERSRMHECVRLRVCVRVRVCVRARVFMSVCSWACVPI